MKTEQLKYKIGLGLVDGVGNIIAKRLIAYCGSAEAVFKEKESALHKIPGVSNGIIHSLKNHQVFERAEKEVEFMNKNNITPLFYLDEAYPKRLKHCDDSPIILYTLGAMNLNADKVISIVGTRNATEYGKEITKTIVEGLKTTDVLVVSGLAYGIDIQAHKTAVKNQIATVGVLAHGLDRIYPSEHSSVAKQMLKQGGIVTEFLSKTKPDKENFPQRNRIIAGLSDAVVVVESKKKGGALITAEIANTYNRDVFAVPGRAEDTYSQGCNWLIKTHRAALIDSVDDIILSMQWDVKKTNNKHQKKLFVQLTQDEEKVVNVLKEKGKLDVDTLCFETDISNSQAAALLLNLEFSGVIKTLPGKVYQLC